MKANRFYLDQLELTLTNPCLGRRMAENNQKFMLQYACKEVKDGRETKG